MDSGLTERTLNPFTMLPLRVHRWSRQLWFVVLLYAADLHGLACLIHLFLIRT